MQGQWISKTELCYMNSHMGGCVIIEKFAINLYGTILKNYPHMASLYIEDSNLKNKTTVFRNL